MTECQGGEKRRRERGGDKGKKKIFARVSPWSIREGKCKNVITHDIHAAPFGFHMLERHTVAVGNLSNVRLCNLFCS